MRSTVVQSYRIGSHLLTINRGAHGCRLYQSAMGGLAPKPDRTFTSRGGNFQRMPRTYTCTIYYDIFSLNPRDGDQKARLRQDAAAATMCN